MPGSREAQAAVTEVKESAQGSAQEVAEQARQSDWSRPSFAKELYLGRFRPDLITPHPRYEEIIEAYNQLRL